MTFFCPKKYFTFLCTSYGLRASEAINFLPLGGYFNITHWHAACINFDKVLNLRNHLTAIWKSARVHIKRDWRLRWSHKRHFLHKRLDFLTFWDTVCPKKRLKWVTIKMETIIQERLQLQGDHRCSHKQHHYQQQEKWKQPKLFMQTLLKELHIHHAFQVKFIGICNW